MHLNNPEIMRDALLLKAEIRREQNESVRNSNWTGSPCRVGNKD